MYYQEINDIGAALGDTHVSVIRLKAILLNILQMQGKFYAAKNMYLHCLQGYKRRLGGRHPDVVAYLTDLVDDLGNQNKLVVAEAMYREALAQKT